jgi:hypothetical protein
MKAAAAAESHLHLVRNHQNAVPSAANLHSSKEVRRRNDHPAIGLYGLKEQGGDFLRRHRALKQGIQVVERGSLRVYAPVAVGVRVGDQRQPFRFRCVGLSRMAGDSHGARRAAVIGAAEGDDASPSSRRHHCARNGLVSIRAGMPKPDAAACSLWHDRK